MQGQEFDICDLPFDGYYASKVERKRGSWGCPFGRHHGHDPAFGPFGRPGFDHGSKNQGPYFGTDHHRFGPLEDGHRKPGCGRWGSTKRESDGPSEQHFHGPPGFSAGHDGRPHDFPGHGASSQHFGAQPWWFGRRGPAVSQEHPWGGHGPDQRL